MSSRERCVFENCVIYADGTIVLTRPAVVAPREPQHEPACPCDVCQLTRICQPQQW